MIIKNIELNNRKLYKDEHFTPGFGLHNNLFEFTALEHKLKRLFCPQKPVLNVRLNF